MIDGMKVIKEHATHQSDDAEKVIRPLYHEILKAIEQDGIAWCKFFDKVYEFDFVDDFYGVELSINGKYDRDLQHDYEVADLLVREYKYQLYIRGDKAPS